MRHQPGRISRSGLSPRAAETRSTHVFRIDTGRVLASDLTQPRLGAAPAGIVSKGAARPESTACWPAPDAGRVAANGIEVRIGSRSVDTRSQQGSRIRMTRSGSDGFHRPGLD